MSVALVGSSITSLGVILVEALRACVSVADFTLLHSGMPSNARAASVVLVA